MAGEHQTAVRVMERYGAECPEQLPQPVYMPDVPPRDDDGVVADAQDPTVRATREQVEAALAGGGAT